MSELSELIEINRNIEKQNIEIIRLLKVIAGECEANVSNSAFDEYVVIDELPVEDIVVDGENLLEFTPIVGEVYFLDEDIFKLTIKNNEAVIDNLTGDGESTNFKIAEIIANVSVKKDQSIGDSTVILTDSSQGKLPQTINLCVDQGAKKVFIPWNQSMELIGAPPDLHNIIKLDLYKNEEQLIEKLFPEDEEM